MSEKYQNWSGNALQTGRPSPLITFCSRIGADAAGGATAISTQVWLTQFNAEVANEERAR
jgi:hypothetical protein